MASITVKHCIIIMNHKHDYEQSFYLTVMNAHNQKYIDIFNENSIRDELRM